MRTATVWMTVAALAAVASGQQFLPGVAVGTVANGSVDEASGLSGSRANPGVLWVHNDSGDSARAFAMNTAGDHLGIYNITGAGAWDWEDMAIGPGPAAGDYLYLGDIGDNYAIRGSIKVYRVPEPAVDPNQSPVTVNLAGAESITLQYPDGARDAETLMVDPLSGDLYVVSKRESQSRVYRAAYPQSTGGTVTMDYLGQLPWGWATGGDISPDGDEILIRGYSNASLWTRGSGQSIWDALASAPVTVPVASEPQGEAIGFDAVGDGYFTVSESSHQPIYYYERIGPGDFDEDGDVDCDDIDEMQGAVVAGSGDLTYDLDEDGDVDCDDLRFLIRNYVELQDGSGRVGTEPGDFNLDGLVNGTDLAIMGPNFGQSGVGYCEGNINCDIWLNGTDLAALGAAFGFVAPPAAVPEPVTLALLTVGTAGLLVTRQRRSVLR